MAERAAALATELEARIVRYRDHPMTFAEFQELPDDRHIELVGSILEERAAAQLEHERLQG